MVVSPAYRRILLSLLLPLCACDGADRRSSGAEAPALAPVVKPPEVDKPQPPPALADPVLGLAPPQDRGLDFRRGVSLGLFVSSQVDEERKRIYGQFLDEIKELGATDIQLVVRWAQKDIHANQLQPLPGVTVDDELLSWVMAQAGARHLRVFLLPIVHLEQRKKGHWRGKLAPTDWDAWWQSYHGFIGHYAELGQAHAVDLLAVGSELVSTESQSERWRELIAEVRQIYTGQLTYSANWDHFEPVSFWDALDVAGMTGYQELSRSAQPGEQELIDGWQPFLHRAHAWAARSGKRFVFTEIGYPSQPGAARVPWDYRKRGAPDLQLQLRLYRALYNVWQGDPILGGLYVWNWFGQGGEADGGYTPRHKPSAHVLRHWYTRQAHGSE